MRSTFHYVLVYKRKTRSPKVSPKCNQGGFLSGSIEVTLDYSVLGCGLDVCQACHAIQTYFLKHNGVSVSVSKVFVPKKKITCMELTVFITS